jgi:hypothetical protein
VASVRQLAPVALGPIPWPRRMAGQPRGAAPSFGAVAHEPRPGRLPSVPRCSEVRQSWEMLSESQPAGVPIANQDASLRASVDNASEALAKHRYDNTIAVGVSFREYARQVGVSEGAVRRYANAFEAVRTTGTHLSISDALVIANTSTEQADAIQAVAEARGVSMKTAQRHYSAEVRKVREAAGTSAEYPTCARTNPYGRPGRCPTEGATLAYGDGRERATPVRHQGRLAAKRRPFPLAPCPHGHPEAVRPSLGIAPLRAPASFGPQASSPGEPLCGPLSRSAGRDASSVAGLVPGDEGASWDR